MIPFTWDKSLTERLSCGDLVFVPDAYEAVKNCTPKVDAWLIKADGPAEKITLDLKNLSPEEAGIILAGSLINYYASENN